ncbi:MAG: response regulator, partial [Tunicatimonas sp.]|uniref:response regulator n=1 Tax=Tunicatimonas sp. TaxID=1940096 RepID=UPI003C777311
ATSSCAEAMRYIQEHPDRIDLVFTDLEMGEYSGLDILQALENSSTKGYLITGSSITHDQISAKALIQLLYKPVSPAAFTKAVEQYLELY